MKMKIVLEIDTDKPKDLENARNVLEMIDNNDDSNDDYNDSDFDDVNDEDINDISTE